MRGTATAIDMLAYPMNTPALSQDKCVLEMHDIWKIYESGEVQVKALAGVSLKICAGEFVAIMGASGSGKSTLLNIMGSLDRPTRGTYRLQGVDVSTYSPAQRADLRNQEIGFIFQSFNLLPRTSIFENVEAPLLYSGIRKTERVERVMEALRSVGLEDKVRATPNQLSGGQQQRVAIARALINHPAIVLADEPTGNLDSVTSQEILEMLRELNLSKGITLVMVTHALEAAAFASRKIVMKDGKIEHDEVNGS